MVLAFTRPALSALGLVLVLRMRLQPLLPSLAGSALSALGAGLLAVPVPPRRSRGFLG